MNTKAKLRRAAKTPARSPKNRPTVGARIIEGIEQAVAWTRGENEDVRVTANPDGDGQAPVAVCRVLSDVHAVGRP
jgi:hypothetical protein